MTANMPVELKGHAPTARCYRCGSAKIAGACHHCGLVMCEEHGNRATDQAGKLVSKEFADLGLDDKHAVPNHCENHAHTVKGSLSWLLYAGIAVGVLGILLALASLVTGLLFILIGADVAGWAYFENQRRQTAAQEARPPLPLMPNIDSVHVVETLHGRVRLGKDRSSYTSDADPVAGRIEVAMTLARSDRERLASYREKYKLGHDEPVTFSAGFCVVRGTAGLTFEPAGESSATPLPSGTGLSFAGEIATHPLFALTEGGAPVRWTASNAYILHPSRVPDSVPIWLVPSLVPSSGQRTLELDLHWNKLGDKQRPLVLDSFEEIELQVPTRWGNVEGVKPSAFVSRPDQGVRTIRWTPSKADLAGESLTLTIRFEKEVRQTDKLTGRFKAIFNGTLSGIDGVSLYRPLGGPWLTKPETTIKTEVAVDFELSLEAIRYQDVRVVPNQNRSEDDGLAEVDEFSVIPDYLTVIELTNMLSDNECYVKRVIENPPRGGGRAGLVNRFWDIAGRHYDGVFPIDFHITVTGEEQYEGGIRAHSGNTAARITVQGSYVNRTMEEQIEAEWERLHDLVTNKLTKLKGRDRPVFQPPGDAYKTTSQPPPAESAAAAPPPPPPPRLPADDHNLDRAAVLRQRLEDLTEAVIAGRIDSQMYRELKTTIESELASID